MRTAKLIIYIFLLLVSFPAMAQNKANFHFRKIQVDDGLSESAAYCIIQDSKGFIWIGTKDGLNRYDGQNFRVFRTDIKDTHSLGNNFVRSIVEGPNNILFVGTDAGLYIMDTNTETFRMLKHTSFNPQIQVGINTVMVDKNKLLWFGTMTGSVFTYDIEKDVLTEVLVDDNSLNNSAVWTIFEDKSSQIWIGSRQGLLRYDISTETLKPVTSLFSKQNSYENEVLTIHEDYKGNLWLGTWANGIRRYNKSKNEFRSFFDSESKADYITHIRTIYPYTQNSLLIGADDGLYLFNIDGNTIDRIDVPQLNTSLSDQSVYSITSDREGGLWIGTYFGGVNYLNTSLVSTETYYPDAVTNSLSGKAVSQFCEDKLGNLWIATEDGGVNYFDNTTKRFSQPINTSYHNTHALILDDQELWIGTFSRGIDIYNTQTKKLKNFRYNTENKQSLNDDCIFSLYQVRSGDMYIGTPVGLNIYDKKTKSFRRVDEVSGFVYDIKEDDEGNIWIAMYGTGVVKWDNTEKKWINYEQILDPSHPIVRSKLTSIYIDAKKRIIFTSENKGIFIYEPKTDSFTNISEANGFPNNVVYGILDDHFGNYWASCNKGIVNFKIDNPSSYKLYNKMDGLQSNQFNYKSSYKSRDGKLYFGGINGFSCFYPQELRNNKNKIVPPVEITGFKLLGEVDFKNEKAIREALNKQQNVTISYRNSSFTISYVALSYRSQTQNQYAYKMKGIDDEWNFVGDNRSVTYVNLSPGKYEFDVIASNNDGLWNDVGRTVHIEILPPFWLSLPAKILYLLIIASSTALLFYLSIRKNRMKQERLLESYKNEQQTLAFKSKIDFFTTIAHEIRTPLSLISGPLEEIILSNDGNESTKDNLSLIDKNCDRLSVLMNQLLDFRKMDSTTYVLNPEEIHLKEYIEDLFARFKKTAQRRNVAIELKLLIAPSVTIVSDTDALTKIIGNLLTNALKYTTDKIELKIEERNKVIIVEVKDNGRGISDEHKELVFDPFYQVQRQDNNIGTGIGLSLVKHMTDILGGNISVHDNSMNGTIFRFTFTSLHSKIEKGTEELSSSIIPLADNTLFVSKELNSEVKTNTSVRILVVEDNQDLGTYIKGFLQEIYEVDLAINANEAYKHLETGTYNLIVSDIMMPGEDGLSLTKNIKSNISYSHIPLILLSAKTENSIKIAGLDIGADVFIEKPFSPLFLKAQIASLLENRKALIESFRHSPLLPFSVLTSNSQDEAFIEKLNKEIEANISDIDFSVESLTDALGMSRSNLQRKLRGVCDVTPGEYLRNFRLKKSCILLLETDMRVNEVAIEVGFASASYFSKAFAKHYGMPPKEFVDGYNRESK